jgi:hypothetical protein
MPESFIKQYGEKRTGTNYLRALLAMNYPGTIVLMHVLGDKHSAPVDLVAVRAATRDRPEPARAFVRTATETAPAETTSPGSAEQRAYLDALAEPLTASFDAGRLGFVVSLRHPRAWAAAMARYLGWARDGEGRFGGEHAAALRLLCQEYNRRHEAWSRLGERFDSRCAFIRHEDLLENSEAAVAPWAARLELPCASGPWREVSRRVEAADWDHQPCLVQRDAFGSAFYRAGRDRAQLGRELAAVVRDTIDWNLAGRFGYVVTG